MPSVSDLQEGDAEPSSSKGTIVPNSARSTHDLEKLVADRVKKLLGS
jgi:hypothetical protein